MCCIPNGNAAGKPDFFRTHRSFEPIETPTDTIRETDVPTWGGVYRGGCLDGFMRHGCQSTNEHHHPTN